VAVNFSMNQRRDLRAELANRGCGGRLGQSIDRLLLLAKAPQMGDMQRRLRPFE